MFTGKLPVLHGLIDGKVPSNGVFSWMFHGKQEDTLKLCLYT
jgi:hypothetical protein